MKIYTCEQRSEEWFAIRLGRVTGTSFKDLMSGKTTAGYNNLIADIAAEKVTDEGAKEETYVNEWMERGIELEPQAAEQYELIMGVGCKEVGFVTPETGLYQELIGVSPDRLLDDGGILEIKCPKRSTHWYYIVADKLPSEYYWQVIGQLYVTGAAYCDFMSYYPGMKPFIIRVLPDIEAFKKIETELDILIEKVSELIKKYTNYELINQEI
jgi:putative phage-type endonuclease